MKCDTCNTKYTPIPQCEETEQAVGCSATLYYLDNDHYIVGHYGSRFDMRKYALKPNKYKVGNICDECIQKFLNTGEAYLIEDGIW